ncbi:tetratricopeptide repeat-containing sensor histidine kinase [Hyunsoonleella pacifica]|uniref:histidine kinase n=1 Tax=Hyunsoonleella pacifica TaxID=1080224 RepID=A0A4Q9FMC9_9FLAO|nr:sensor histidine kinase [Hyunsoonleella pacifica]TBN14316.1 tetratricopeptide repeat protein [Hyunsoonleella pacifica]GGD12747.1 hypothetical protein GCM10011368_13400 [Hyunsoonleella pacifica]
MKHRFLSIILTILSFYCSSQNNLKIIDSLKLVIESKPNDSIKIKTYSDLCWYYGRVSNDSALYYGNLALELSKNTRNIVGEAQAYNDLGIIHAYGSNHDESIILYHKSLKIRKVLKDSFGMASIYNKLGFSYHKKFQMDSCLKYNIKALDVYKAIKSERHVFLTKGNIAALYEEMKQYDNALKIHFQTLEISKSIEDSLGLAKVYSNIGNTYLSLNDTIKGSKYYDKALDISENNNYSRVLANLYYNYGKIKENKKAFNEAQVFYQKSYQASEEINDDFGRANALLSIGEVYTKTSNYRKAKEKLYKGLKLSKKIKSKKHEHVAYNYLFNHYSKTVNADSIIYYHNEFNRLKDSIYSDRVTKEIAEVQERYNTAEREKEILTQRADIAEKELNINRKNTQLIGLGLLAVVISLLGYLLFKQQKLKNEQLKKEGELKEALIKIETQNKLQEQRLRISRDLHDNIGAQLTFIISSIENLQYGFNIKNEKLNKKLVSISAFTKDTIYELRDTIWAMNKSEISLEDLQTRISNFVEKADKHSEVIQFQFLLSDNIVDEIIFTSVKGMNIYRIVQEAIHNSIKYADAKNISVKVSKESNQLCIDIVDDGKGFDVNGVSDGNGLNNMRKRAKDINASIVIESEIHNGTSVLLGVPC